MLLDKSQNLDRFSQNQFLNLLDFHHLFSNLLLFGQIPLIANFLNLMQFFTQFHLYYNCIYL